jgi:predicted HTH transcriptional regulator
MSEEWSLDELYIMAESVDVECKAAQGRDGKSELPDDFWKSYSAMANTEGGVIWLGIQEKPRGTFNVIGLADIEKIRKAIWDNLHNRKQISFNLLIDHNIQPVLVNHLTVLRVEVPRASRQNKPVHLGNNPFGGTYLRRYEGDYLADDETVRRLLAERVEDSRDDRILKGFDFTDLDMDTVAAYRNRFTAVKPGHVWTDLSLPDFLERIGAFGKNREEGYSGLRLAGLLMFGRAEVIRDALPNYMVDYQERPEPKVERRWIDRLAPDGSWSGNVYDFFRKVYQKLTADLKVPFQLQDGQRIEDTPVHEALREALVNTLIHADFSGRVSVLVVKRPDMFGFRNPGLMRIPMAQAVAGGTSDCRNRRLQTMFQLVGYGDHAGSGLPKIYHNWAGQHWRRPVLYELREPEQTLMELRMSSLLPADAVAELESHLGDRFASLSQLERLAMVMATTEGMLNHSRLREISTDHPSDITKMLARLVRDGLLISDGVGRGMVYFLPWLKRQGTMLFDHDSTSSLQPAPERIALDSTFIPPQLGDIPPQLGDIPPQLGDIPPQLGDIPIGLPTLYLEWEQLDSNKQQELQTIALSISEFKRVRPEVLRTTILKLCEGRYLGRRVLAQLLNRNPDDLLKRTLNPLVEDQLLQPAFPSNSDPRQAYTTHHNAFDRFKDSQ